MKVLILENPDQAADRAAQGILRALRRKPKLVLGLATGSTPIRIYERLIEAHQKDGVDFSGVHTFNLDEYLGLPPEHKQSYYYFMRQHLFDGINVPDAQIHFPPRSGPKISAQCREFEARIREVGGIDIQILGIGSNGHIGFNEPTSSLASRTRIKTLTDKTLRDNSRFYGPDEEQPQLATTMGIGTILEARAIVLQAFGVHKAEAIRAAIEGPVSSVCPGSALQLHPNVTVFLDGDSSADLSMRDYYLRAARLDDELRADDMI